MADTFNPFSRGKDQEEAVKAGATNLTLGSGIVALLAVLAQAFTGFVEKVLGEGKTADVAARKDLLVALFFAWAIVCAADILARAYAKAATEHRKTAEASAEAAASVLLSAPPNLKASIPGKDQAEEGGWTVVALRAQDDDATKLQFLMAKAGHSAEWQSEDKVKFQ